MYMRLDEIDAAMPVLDEAIASLEKHAAPGDAALNRARAYLAAAWLQTSDDLQRTGALAAKARDVLRVAEVECAKVRVYAGSTLSQIASFCGRRRTRAGGNPAHASRMPNSPSVRAHEDIAMQLLHLAMVARNAGHLVEASDAVSVRCPSRRTCGCVRPIVRISNAPWRFSTTISGITRRRAIGWSPCRRGPAIGMNGHCCRDCWQTSNSNSAMPKPR